MTAVCVCNAPAVTGHVYTSPNTAITAPGEQCEPPGIRPIPLAPESGPLPVPGETTGPNGPSTPASPPLAELPPAWFGPVCGGVCAGGVGGGGVAVAGGGAGAAGTGAAGAGRLRPSNRSRILRRGAGAGAAGGAGAGAACGVIAVGSGTQSRPDAGRK